MFERAATSTPNYGTLEVNLAIVSHALGDDATAGRHFARALALSPAHPATHEYVARWLVQTGRAGEAVPHLEYALRLAPASLDVRHRLLELDAASGAAETQALALETLALVPGDSIATACARGEPLRRPAAADHAGWMREALALTRDGRDVEAIGAYRCAIRLDSTDVDALNNLGWSLARVGFPDAALPWLRAAVRRAPHDRLAANNLAWAEGRVDDALFMRAYALQTTGRPAAAVATYDALLARHPRWANAHANRGWALRALGRRAEADAELQRAEALRAASGMPALATRR
jgi:Tfp pilus assembly protein PilF